VRFAPLADRRWPPAARQKSQRRCEPSGSGTDRTVRTAGRAFAASAGRFILPHSRAAKREAPMAMMTFTAPRQWEDWASWLLGFWLLLSPWILHFEEETAATQNAVVLGFVLILAEVVTLSAFVVWEEWINIALGSWLVVSPWVLRGVGAAASANFVLVGLLVIALAAYEMWQVANAREPRT
jgi:hypothetical protein